MPETSAKIFTVAYGGGHIKMIVPVAKALQERGHDVTLLALTGAGPVATAAGLAHRGYLAYLPLVERPEAQAHGERLAANMHNPELGISLEESVAYLGINYAELVDTYGPDEAAVLFARVGRQVFLPVQFLRRVLESERPDVVLTTNSPRTELASLIAARQVGIPSVRIEDLFFEVDSAKDLIQRLGGPEIYRRTLGRWRLSPDRLCVNSAAALASFKRSRDVLGFDVPDDHVVVTGQPILEAIDVLMQAPPAYDLVKRKAGGLTVTWAHQNGTPDGDAVLRLLSDWRAGASEDVAFVIKLHPNCTAEEQETVERAFARKGALPMVLKGERDANDVLWNSHVVMSQESTMLLQAGYMGKPLLVLDPQGRRGESAYVAANLAKRVETAKELGTLMEDELRAIRSCSRTVPALNGFPRHATSNIVAVVEELLSS